jgi:hypothetical protein
MVDLNVKYDMDNKQQQAEFEAEEQATVARVQTLQEQVDQRLGSGSMFNDFTDEQPIHETEVEVLRDDKTCNKCEKHFETHMELCQHKRYCRRPGASRIVLKQGEVWPCDFCPEQFASSWKLKRHVF